MKEDSLIFIFTSTSNDCPQLSWTLKNLIDPQKHKIKLIFSMEESLFILNNPHEILNCAIQMQKLENQRYKEVLDFLENSKSKILEYFGKNFVIGSFVVVGSFDKIKSKILAFGKSVIVLGPDTECWGIKSIFGGDWDKFICSDLKLPLIRIASNN